MKKFLAVMSAMCMFTAMLTGCGAQETAADTTTDAAATEETAAVEETAADTATEDTAAADTTDAAATSDYKIALITMDSID